MCQLFFFIICTNLLAEVGLDPIGAPLNFADYLDPEFFFPHNFG